MKTLYRIALFLALTLSGLAQIIPGGGIQPVAKGGTGTATGSITGTGALTFTAGGIDQNVTVAPSGVGNITLSGTTGGVRIPSTNTAGLQIYNTSDQTTNYERFAVRFETNVAKIRSEAAGSGSNRSIAIGVNNGGELTVRGAGSASGMFQFLGTSNNVAGQIGLNFNNWGSTATSGNTVGISFTPTYNQSASTAGNTDLLINRTETAVGSGVQYLIQAQVGGTDRFRIGNLGDAYVQNKITVGTSTFNSKLTLAGGISQAAWGAAGTRIQVAAATDTDTSTAISGTAALATFSSFAQPTLAATNTTVTTTDAANVYIAGPVVAGTNQTITRSHSLAIVDSTASTTSITGGLVVATSLGTTATSVGIGGGSINAGGGITANGTLTANAAFAVSGAATFNGGSTTALTIQQNARTSGVLPYIKWTIPADTGLTAATEAPGLQTVTGTRTWATTGTVATQRENLFVAPTYASASASQTFTDAATVAISGAPIAGTNAIITNGYSLWVQGGNSRFDGGILASTANGRIGFQTGKSAGGAVTQITSRTTGVTLNTPTGAITLVSAAGTATWQTFTVTNSTVSANDVPEVVQQSGTDLYQIFVTKVQAGSFNVSFATTGGTTTESPVFNFVVIKGSNN